MAFREVAGNNIFQCEHIQCDTLVSAHYTQENDATALTRNAPVGKPWQAVVWEASLGRHGEECGCRIWNSLRPEGSNPISVARPRGL